MPDSGETPAATVVAASRRVRGAPPRTVAETLRARRTELTPAELRIAQALLGDYPSAGLQSVASIAAVAGVSAPTVVRLVAKLGFRGHADFQRQLRTELSTRMAGPVQLYRDAAVPESKSSLLRRCAPGFGRSVLDALRATDEVEFERAVALLADRARPVVLTGGRASANHARYLASYLELLRPAVRYLGPERAARGAALLDMGPSHTVVVFDFHRYERETVDFARVAAERGAAIVLFTDPYLSPIAASASALLTATVEGPGPFITLTPAFALVETLIIGVVERTGRAARRRLADFDELNPGVVG